MRPSTTRRDPRTAGAEYLLWFLSLLGFFAIFSTTISKSPVLSLFVRGLGGSDSLLGIIAALSPFAGILVSFPVGVLADRIGYKKLLILSSLFFAFAPLSYLFVTNPLWLIPIRFLHGWATAILSPVASALIAGAYPDTKGRQMGTYSSATFVGRMAAPLVGGLLMTWGARGAGLWEYHVVYWAAFVTGLIVLGLALIIREPPKSDLALAPRLRRSDFADGLAYFVKDARMLSTAFVETATYFAFGVFETYLPVYLLGLGVDPGRIGLIFSAQVLAIAALKPFFGAVADKIDKRLQIMGGIAATAGVIAVFPYVSSYGLLLAVSVVFGGAMAFSTVATAAYIADVADDRRLGTAMGAFSSVMDIGHSGGPLIVGFVITALSVRAGFLISGAVALVALIYFYTRNY